MAFGGFSGFDINRGAEFGASLSQPNALGTFVRGLLGKVNAMQSMQMESRLKTQAEVETQKQLLPIKEASATRLLQEKARLFPPVPKPLAGDTAGRLSLASQGEKFAQRARGLLFPTGTPESFDRGIIAATHSPFGIGMIGNQKAQDVEFYLKRAIDSQLRAETGAAVSPGELDRLTKEFISNALADPHSAFTKLSELEAGLRKTRSAIDPTGYYSNLGQSPFATTGDNEDLSSLSDEDILRGAGLME